MNVIMKQFVFVFAIGMKKKPVFYVLFMFPISHEPKNVTFQINSSKYV